MNLENVTVELRPRTEWEAAELGVRMIRRDAASIYKVWFAITLPMFAITALVSWYTSWSTTAFLVYWWLESITDGPILRIISRRLFGEAPDVGATIRSTARLAWQNKLFWLTPYRLHFARSTAVPVTQLEGLTGSRRRARSKTIGQRVFNHGMGVTVAYQHLVLALFFGVVMLVFMFLPETYLEAHGGDMFDMLFESSDRSAMLINLVLFYIAQSALHPWFVGAGFGLYINCRTQLEAWDIEVAFRRMMQRRQGLMTACVAILAFAMTAVGNPVQAQDDQQADEDPGFHGFWTDEQVDPALKRVLELEELNRYVQEEEWQRIDSDEPEERDAPSDFGGFYDVIEFVGTVISRIVEAGLWIAVGLLLLMVYLTRDRWLPYLAMLQVEPPRRPRIILADGELTAEQLPDDIPAEVLGLWRSGQKRDALGLLYRGTVFAAVHQFDARVPESATEGACLKAVSNATGNEQAAHFKRIVNAWILCAYASRHVADDVVSAICDEWPRFYGVEQ